MTELNTSVRKEEVAKFLTEANKAGYASGQERKWTKEDDSSTTIAYRSGDWRFHDNFFGGEPYGGREVIFYREKPVWIMVYYGWVDKTERDVRSVYGFLQAALKGIKPDEIRGPTAFQKDGLTYANSCTGDFGRFEGEESISRDDQIIYRAGYSGGLVDQRQEGP